MGMVSWLAARRPWARGVQAKRGFDAARPSRTAAGFSAYAGTKSINEDLRWDLRGLIAHSRKQAQNNDYLKSYLALVRRNVIGPAGVRFQNDARTATDAPDKASNDQIEQAWARWGQFGNPTLDGELSWLGVETLAAQSVARDGTILLRQYFGRGFGPFLYKLQPLEIDFLDIELSRDSADGAHVRMGVEFDGDGRRVAYHLFTTHPGEHLPGRSRDRIRVPAAQILCVFRPERAGQVLGMPWSYSALRRLNMLRGYEEAAITAARVGAAKMGFYEQTDVEAAAADPQLLMDRDEEMQGRLVKEVEPGMFETLPRGYVYKEHNPAYPTGEIRPFMQVVLQGAAAGLDVSYATLANDLTGANFSSLRAGKGEERDEWRCLQQWIIENLHDRVFRSWFPMAMLSGELGALPVTRIDTLMQPRWRPRGWAYVSPGEEANANQREMAAMIRSPQQIVAERGEDLETVFADIAAARELAESYGLTFDPRPPGHEQGGQQPAAEPEP